MLRDGPRDDGLFICFDAVRLTGSGNEERVEVLFRETERHEGNVYGFSYALWDDPHPVGELPMRAYLLALEIDETVESAEMGLPTRSAQGEITWIN